MGLNLLASCSDAHFACPDCSPILATQHNAYTTFVCIFLDQNLRDIYLMPLRGDCSGMSYVMEFEDTTKVAATDTEIKFDGFRVVVDSKSLMFVYGMRLNYR